MPYVQLYISGLNLLQICLSKWWLPHAFFHAEPISLTSIWGHWTQYLQSSERTRHWHMACYLRHKFCVYNSSFDSITNLIVNFVLNRKNNWKCFILKIRDFDSFLKHVIFHCNSWIFPSPFLLFLSLMVVFPNSFLLSVKQLSSSSFGSYSYTFLFWSCIIALGSGMVIQAPETVSLCFTLLSRKIRWHGLPIKFS